jgi:hypothetical protein
LVNTKGEGSGAGREASMRASALFPTETGALVADLERQLMSAQAAIAVFETATTPETIAAARAAQQRATTNWKKASSKFGTK